MYKKLLKQYHNTNILKSLWDSVKVSIHYNTNDKDNIIIEYQDNITLNDFISYLKAYKKDYGKKTIKRFKTRYNTDNFSIVFDSDISNMVLYNNDFNYDGKEVNKLMEIKARYLQDTDNFRLTTKEKNFLIKNYDKVINNLLLELEKLEIASKCLKQGKRKNGV